MLSTYTCLYMSYVHVFYTYGPKIRQFLSTVEQFQIIESNSRVSNSDGVLLFLPFCTRALRLKWLKQHARKCSDKLK